MATGRVARYEKHGMHGTPEHTSWRAMRDRCYNPKNANFHLYGGRGITVCERWRSSLAAFLEDVGPRPSLKHSLDRYPDKNGDYEPGNVRWATEKEQQRNRRSNRPVTWNGKTQLLVEWAEEYGIPKQILVRRFSVAGWTLERALTLPIQKQFISKRKSYL